jgi:GH24 family phage-related lysozyme (muramidase)
MVTLLCLLFAAQAGEVMFKSNGFGTSDNLDWLRYENTGTDSHNKDTFYFRQDFDQAFKLFDLISTICVETGDNYVVNSGAKAFATQWLCLAGDCDRNTHFNMFVFSGDVSFNAQNHPVFGRTRPSDFESGKSHEFEDIYNPCTGSANDSPSCTVGDHLSLAMKFNVNHTLATSSHLPTWGQESHYKCYYKINGHFVGDYLEYYDVNIDAWESFNVALFSGQTNGTTSGSTSGGSSGSGTSSGGSSGTGSGTSGSGTSSGGTSGGSTGSGTSGSGSTGSGSTGSGSTGSGTSGSGTSGSGTSGSGTSGSGTSGSGTSGSGTTGSGTTGSGSTNNTTPTGDISADWQVDAWGHFQTGPFKWCKVKTVEESFIDPNPYCIDGQTCSSYCQNLETEFQWPASMDGDYIGGLYVGDTSVARIPEPAEDQENMTCHACGTHIEMLAWAEGVRYCAYFDQIGVYTIGIGFNLERWDIESRKPIMCLDIDALKAGTKRLTDFQMKSQLMYDLSWSIDEAKNIFSSFFEHPQCVQQLLADWVFNRGGPDIARRTTLINAINAKNYHAAADYLESTSWCTLIARRCRRHLNILRSCN